MNCLASISPSDGHFFFVLPAQDLLIETLDALIGGNETTCVCVSLGEISFSPVSFISEGNTNLPAVGTPRSQSYVRRRWRLSFVGREVGVCPPPTAPAIE